MSSAKFLNTVENRSLRPSPRPSGLPASFAIAGPVTFFRSTNAPATFTGFSPTPPLEPAHDRLTRLAPGNQAQRDRQSELRSGHVADMNCTMSSNVKINPAAAMITASAAPPVPTTRATITATTMMTVTTATKICAAGSAIFFQIESFRHTAFLRAPDHRRCRLSRTLVRGLRLTACLRAVSNRDFASAHPPARPAAYCAPTPSRRAGAICPPA